MLVKIAFVVGLACALAGCGTEEVEKCAVGGIDTGKCCDDLLKPGCNEMAGCSVEEKAIASVKALCEAAVCSGAPAVTGKTCDNVKLTPKCCTHLKANAAAGTQCSVWEKECGTADLEALKTASADCLECSRVCPVATGINTGDCCDDISVKGCNDKKRCSDTEKIEPSVKAACDAVACVGGPAVSGLTCDDIVVTPGCCKHVKANAAAGTQCSVWETECTDADFQAFVDSTNDGCLGCKLPACTLASGITEGDCCTDIGLKGCNDYKRCDDAEKADSTVKAACEAATCAGFGAGGSSCAATTKITPQCCKQVTSYPDGTCPDWELMCTAEDINAFEDDCPQCRVACNPLPTVPGGSLCNLDITPKCCTFVKGETDQTCSGWEAKCSSEDLAQFTKDATNCAQCTASLQIV